MYNFSGGNHDMEHERLIRLLRFLPYSTTTLPAASTANTGQRISYKTLDYYSDGTRWLSVNKFPLTLSYNTNGTFTSPLSATSTAYIATTTADEGLPLYVEKLISRNQVNTTLDATNNWTLELFRQSSAVVNTSLGTVNTFQTGRVAGTPYLNTITVNTALTLFTDAYLFFMTATKNAAPGTLTFQNAILWVRLIAT